MTGPDRAERRGGFMPMAALLGAAILLSPVRPFPLLAIPFALLLVAFRPRDLFALGVAAALLVLVFRAPANDLDAGWYMLRGWCLVTAGLFVALSVLRAPRLLLDRAFITVSAVTGLLAALAIRWPAMGASLDGWMEEQIGHAATMARTILLSDPQVASGDFGESVGAAIDGWAMFQHDVYPALLALATMSALAVGWYFSGRRGEEVDRPPPVREFGFRDGYVWLLVIGLALLVLPLGATAFRVGENATLFMTLLYVARGGAILVWVVAAAATSAWTWALLGASVVLAYPFVFGAALLLGIGDTWLHVRERLAMRIRNGPGRRG